MSDHYRVLDPAALSATLAAQADVSGDAQQGWQRLAQGECGVQRMLSTINPRREAGRDGEPTANGEPGGACLWSWRC